MKTKYRILVTPTSFLKPQNARAKNLLEDFAAEVVYNDLGVPLQGDEILKRLEGIDGYIAGLDYITSDVIEDMPSSVQVISRYGVGVERVDLAACAKKGIKLCNTPGANSVAVCELAFAGMLAVSRNLIRLHEAVERGEWPRNEGCELYGKTLGIIGLGAIGKNLALRAKAFGMNVTAFDPFMDTIFAKENDIEVSDLHSVLTYSDYVSLHLPLNEQTRHMINAETIKDMKKGVIIVNTSRGGIVDENAAAEALKFGKIGGLVIDAFEQEPLKDSPLKGLPNVLLTPHTGAHTAEAIDKMGYMAVENLINVLNGKPCKHELKLS
ncbi:MAG: phosphoglycerate dehydrogenase [Planctomycetia bacterium]|nr:phosphoglycerate dehydrogenase [Planctomycetia bacterium]